MDSIQACKLLLANLLSLSNAYRIDRADNILRHLILYYDYVFNIVLMLFNIVSHD